MKNLQDEYPEQDPETGANGPARPQSLRKDKRSVATRSRAMNRKGNTHGGMHERGNRKGYGNT